MNLSGDWTALWSRLVGQLGGLSTILGIIGVAILIGAIFKFFYDKKKGGGGNTQGVMWAALIGATLSAPNIILPVCLKIIDIIVNGVVAVFKI